MGNKRGANIITEGEFDFKSICAKIAHMLLCGQNRTQLIFSDFNLEVKRLLGGEKMSSKGEVAGEWVGVKLG